MDHTCGKVLIHQLDELIAATLVQAVSVGGFDHHRVQGLLPLPGGIPDDGGVALASPKGSIVLVWGVGGVLTDDGTLWQFRPESRRWVTVDQSFALDGERRKVLPLPVSAGEIADMRGFGFIVTKGGSAWLYNLDSDAWENIGAPGH